MKAWMDHRCLKGSPTLLKVASRYNSFALVKNVSISDVKKSWRRSWTQMSSFRKSAGIASSCTSKSNVVGLEGRVPWRRLFDWRIKVSKWGRDSVGASLGRWSRRALLTMDDADWKGWATDSLAICDRAFATGRAAALGVQECAWGPIMKMSPDCFTVAE